MQQATQTKNDDGSYPLGFKQNFFFDPNGWFEGEVKGVSDEQGNEVRIYTVFFSVDNTTEQFTQCVMEEQEELSKIPFGDVNHNFVKLFRVQGGAKNPLLDSLRVFLKHKSENVFSVKEVLSSI